MERVTVLSSLSSGNRFASLNSSEVVKAVKKIGLEVSENGEQGPIIIKEYLLCSSSKAFKG
jgi:hypothetical protein